MNKWTFLSHKITRMLFKKHNFFEKIYRFLWIKYPFVAYYHKIVVQETQLSWKDLQNSVNKISFMLHIITKSLFKNHSTQDGQTHHLFSTYFWCHASSLQPPPIGDDFVWGNGLIVRRNLRQKMFHITSQWESITTPPNHTQPTTRTALADAVPFPTQSG